MAEANGKPAEEKHAEGDQAHNKETTRQGPAQQGPETHATQHQAPAKQQMDEKQVRNWAMLCHLLGLAGLVVPLGNVIGPLIIWLIKKEEDPFIDYNGKESLNFQISISIYMIAAGFLTMILIGIVLFPAVGIFGIVVVIIASLKANKGEKYRYPLCIRFIR